MKTLLARKSADTLFRSLDRLEQGSLTLTTPDGQVRSFGGLTDGPQCTVALQDWQVIRNVALRGDIGLAEDYRAGRWETDDLQKFFELGLSNRDAFQRYVLGNRWGRWAAKLSYFLRMNTRNGSRKNIHAHYDLGNEFYKLWLDPTMTYSAAIYQNPDEDLLSAQLNKYDRILERLGPNPGNILEVGCGWGGFADRASERSDCTVKGITISNEQHAYADERLKNVSNANAVLEDYRDQKGRYNNLVSIEMFEAVGEHFWPTYFSKMKSLLAEKGRAVVQTITINTPDFESYRTGGDFIRSYIFPGGMLPSVPRFDEEVSKAELKAGDHFYFGQDYARTLEEWLVRFDDRREDVRALGFDDGFIRLWRFYLAACAAGFRTGRTDVMQAEIVHA